MNLIECIVIESVRSSTFAGMPCLCAVNKPQIEPIKTSIEAAKYRAEEATSNLFLPGTVVESEYCG